jgi:hypothetical protein
MTAGGQDTKTGSRPIATRIAKRSYQRSRILPLRANRVLMVGEVGERPVYWLEREMRMCFGDTPIAIPRPSLAAAARPARKRGCDGVE